MASNESGLAASHNSGTGRFVKRRPPRVDIRRPGFAPTKMSKIITVRPAQEAPAVRSKLPCRSDGGMTLPPPSLRQIQRLETKSRIARRLAELVGPDFTRLKQPCLPWKPGLVSAVISLRPR